MLLTCGAALGSRTPDLRITSRPAGQRTSCDDGFWGLDSRVRTQRRHSVTRVRGQARGQDHCWPISEDDDAEGCSRRVERAMRSWWRVALTLAAVVAGRATSRTATRPPCAWSW